MKKRTGNETKKMIGDISMFMNYLLNPVIVAKGDVSILDAMKMLNKDVELVIVNIGKSGEMKLFDKDIMLELLLKETDRDNYIFEFCSEDYCIMDDIPDALSSENKYVVVQDIECRVKGVFKRILLEKIMREIDNFKKKSMKNVTKNKLEDDNSDIVVNRVIPLKHAVDNVERKLITMVMNEVNSTYKAAKILDVSQATIARKTKRYNDEMIDCR